MTHLGNSILDMKPSPSRLPSPQRRAERNKPHWISNCTKRTRRLPSRRRMSNAGASRLSPAARLARSAHASWRLWASAKDVHICVSPFSTHAENNLDANRLQPIDTYQIRQRAQDDVDKKVWLRCASPLGGQAAKAVLWPTLMPDSVTSLHTLRPGRGHRRGLKSQPEIAERQPRDGLAGSLDMSDPRRCACAGHAHKGVLADLHSVQAMVAQ